MTDLPSTRPSPPVREHRHRDVQSGVARASVFGAYDGLVTNASLVLGVAGADSASSFVRITGVLGLIAGAVSMGLGEYLSMNAQAELFERELELERRELERNPHVEAVELAQIYMARGVEPDTARRMADEMMADPDRALEAHAREELGIDPSSLGSPVRAALGSFGSFAAGALAPLLPWFFLSGTTAVIVSLVLAVVAAASIGLLLARLTHRSRLKSAARYVIFMVVATTVTFIVGRLIGATVLG
jgi:VIT1/CCC1 family predicted Fe2+/Mn2+ transporter